MIKDLAEELKNHFFLFRRKHGKVLNLYVMFPSREVTRTYKIGEQVMENIPYILQFIDDAKFMARY